MPCKSRPKNVSAEAWRVRRPLLATGFLGGIDIGFGVLAYLVVDEKTGKPLGAVAFTIGFIALLLARSELFTENFLRNVVRARLNLGEVQWRRGMAWHLNRPWASFGTTRSVIRW